jgi:hypothetical protein
VGGPERAFTGLETLKTEIRRTGQISHLIRPGKGIGTAAGMSNDTDIIVRPIACYFWAFFGYAMHT